MVPIGESIKEEIPSGTQQQREKASVENHASEENPRNGVTTLQPGKRGDLPSITTIKMEPLPDSATDKLRLNQGVTASPKTPKKGLQSPESGALPLQSGQEGSTPSTIREKVSEDGYNWRKYGQKLVKGNEYVRSYYRCTHPNCLVKKQLERLHDGQVVDIVYFGQHDHPKPQLNVPVTVGLVVSIVEERRKEASLTTAEDISADEHRQQPPQSKTVDIPPILNISAKDSTEGTDSHSNKIKDEVHIDDDPDSKRQKKDRDSLKTTTPDKSTSEPRVIVHTRSEVDIVNDGYRWRKYGQKMVKGNPNPRSYYRCSNSGCPVKKHVERASHDPKMVMTTYEGQHNHDIPAARIVTHNVSGSNLSPTSHNGDSITKSDGNTNRLDMVVDAILEQRSKPKEEQNAKLTSGSASKDTKCSNVVVESCPRPETKASKRQNIKSSVKEESDSIRSIPGQSRTSDNLVVKSSIIKSEGNNTCVVDMVVRDNIKTEQQNPDSEPVHG